MVGAGAQEREVARFRVRNDRLQQVPNGLHAVVGERGRQLSAGERQRLAIARAFLADPAVLVLDEATGALDPATEAGVLQGYQSLMGGRTTVIVTHRPELARHADRVVVIQEGRVVEDSVPSSLAEAADPFSALFALPAPS